MTVKELIKELKKYPQNSDVVIFDWRANLHVGADESSVGVYSDIYIQQLEEIADEEGESTAILLLFDNEDYTDDGELVGRES
jgi:DNA-binding Lrp family transcriptional regulator